MEVSRPANFSSRSTVTTDDGGQYGAFLGEAKLPRALATSAYWCAWLAVCVIGLGGELSGEDQLRWISPYAWWVAPLLLYWTAPRLPSWHKGWVQRLSGLVVLAASIYFLQWLTFEATDTLFDLRVRGPLALLEFVVQGVVVGVLVGAIYASVWRKLVGDTAVLTVIAVTAVALVPGYWDGVWGAERWRDRPLASGIHLFRWTIVALLSGWVYVKWPRRGRARALPVSATGERASAMWWRQLSLRDSLGAFALCVMLGMLIIVAAVYWAAMVDSYLLAVCVWIVAALIVFVPLTLFGHRADVHLRGASHGRSLGSALTVTGARVGVAAGLVCYWSFGLLFVAPKIGETAIDGLRAARGPMWTMDWDSHTRVLAVRGEIHAGYAQAVQRAVERYEVVEVLELEGPGGYSREAIPLAHWIRERGLRTWVRGDCASACVFVFSGGVDRRLGPEGQLGFHRGSDYGLPDFESEAVYRRVLVDLGVRRDFAAKAFAVPNADMWYPEAAELVEAGVVTGITGDVWDAVKIERPDGRDIPAATESERQGLEGGSSDGEAL
jgi:hypothetical protein